MPRVPRAPQSDNRRHNPLAEEYSPSNPFKQKSGHKERKSRSDGNEERDQIIDTKASRTILRIGKELTEEDEAQSKRIFDGVTQNSAFSFDNRFGGDVESDDEGERYEEWEDEDGEVDEEADDVDPHDLATFNRFNPPTFDDPILRPGESSPPPENGQTTNLADLILAKISAHEAAEAKRPPSPTEEVTLSDKVGETYVLIGQLLSRYRSGALPKAFKILPTLPIPTQLAILPLTNPDKWTPHAIYAATKIFISQKSPIAQGFLTNVLLDRVREEIAETRKLNVHLYDALKKSLFRPQAFFKGLLFPLLEDGTCTLREAHIISSVITRVSVPVIHAAVAMSKIADMAADQMQIDTEAAGATNTFLKVFLEKRYALPYQTVDAMVFHFLRFKNAGMNGGMDVDGEDQRSYDGKLPVIWHQCFLAFARYYKDAITEDQREALLDLLLVRGHKDIAPEIRRELLAGRGRGVVAEPTAGEGGDDTMMDA